MDRTHDLFYNTNGFFDTYERAGLFGPVTDRRSNMGENVKENPKNVGRGDSGKRRDNPRKRKALLRWKIMLVAILPMFLMALLIGGVAAANMSSGMKQVLMKSLKTEVHSLKSVYDTISDAPYFLDGDDLMKGGFNVSKRTELLDSFVEGTAIDVTIFYGDTRMATTLEDGANGRIVGTKADADIVEQVIGKGEPIERYDLMIDGKKYYAYYDTLCNPDGSIVGMVFAGEQSKDTSAMIIQRMMIIMVVEVVIVLLSLLIVLFMTKGIQTGIRDAEKAVKSLASGNLTTEIGRGVIRRNDELGDMARGIAALLQKLMDVVNNIRESSARLLQSGTELSRMADQTSSTADDISKAIEGISRGAIDQADEIEKASREVDAMGQMIGHIAGNVAELDKGTQEIRDSSDRSMDIIQDLSSSNDRSMDAIRQIAAQVNATNESAQKIRAAVDLITSIAEETNLLSLNASIEAARAGEQGRGFAVVAGQIQKLAEQSNQSAVSIADVIEGLIRDSENTVRIMEQVQEIMNEQQDKLHATRSQFAKVGREVSEAADAAGMIRSQTERCDESRANVVDVITNLSAISEENAASAQQTTASMEELNVTISTLAESARQLQELSDSLEENIFFFQMGENRIRDSIQKGLNGEG